MINKNRYYYRSRISESKFRQLVRCFALDFTATSTAQLIGISARLVSSIYLKIRQRMAEACEDLFNDKLLDDLVWFNTERPH